ncbi:MAG: hypothetical protein EOP52_03170 [Sphingobacteriales bacterium]|nr:MAG: hypothetical protein EOP52_03170 [Sphingobacteriales bacterium]
MSGKFTSIAGGRMEYTAQKLVRVESTSASTEIQSAKETVFNSGGKVNYNRYQPGQGKNIQTAEVEEIRLVTPPDQGCDWREGGALRDGLIAASDKTYTFEVVKFRNNVPPRANSDIKWAYRYEGENGVVEGALQQKTNGAGGSAATGRQIVLNLSSNLDICGRGLTIYAYIGSQDAGASLNVWVHYRFRFFGRALIKEQTTARASGTGAYLIDQGSTSLCGMANIFYILAKTNPSGYEQLALKLHQTGTATLNSYTIAPGEKEMYDVVPKKTPYPTRIPEIDWVVMASTRSKESNLGYSGEAGQDFSAINYPSILVKLKKELLGFGEVVDKTSFFMNPTPLDKLDWIIEMQKAYQEGYHVSMLIDSDMLSDSPTRFANFTRWHWVVYEGGLYVDDAAGTYNFKYWCWGRPAVLGKFRHSVFNTNFYGYIKGK